MTRIARGAGSAGRSQTARRVVLFGWAAKGVVYVALAYLVLQTAFGSASQDASTTGALRLIAREAPGKVVLVVLGLGLIAFAVGRVLEVTTLAGPQIDGKDRVTAAFLVVVYTSLALTAFSLVGLAGSGGGDGSEQQGSAFLLGLPGGRWIVGLIGVAVVGFGARQAYEGVEQDFLGTLRLGEMSSGVRSGVGTLGTAAYVTKGAVLGLLGWFFLRSAVTFDPSEAKGLDAALQEIAGQTWGQVVLTLVAAGLLAYGVFAFVEARYRRVGSSASGTT